MVIRKGLQMLVCGDRHLGRPVVHLVGHPAPLLFLGCHELTDQVLEPTLALDQQRGTLGDLLLEGLVQAPDLFLGLLALGDLADDREYEASGPAVRIVYRSDGAQGQLDPNLLTVLP